MGYTHGHRASSLCPSPGTPPVLGEHQPAAGALQSSRDSPARQGCDSNTLPSMVYWSHWAADTSPKQLPPFQHCLGTSLSPRASHHTPSSWVANPRLGTNSALDPNPSLGTDPPLGANPATERWHPITSPFSQAPAPFPFPGCSSPAQCRPVPPSPPTKCRRSPRCQPRPPDTADRSLPPQAPLLGVWLS